MQDVILDPLNQFECPHCGQNLLPLAPEPFTTLTCPGCKAEVPVPGRFGQYLLLNRLNDSVISSVFDAKDPKLDRPVSLKILNHVLCKNSELAEAFRREALAAASLNSPNVLKVYEFGTHNGQPFMVMENIEGMYLNDLLRTRPLPDSDILVILEGIVQGLMDTHEQGIVHGDVMPRNILIDKEGTPKICDFGLARIPGQDSLHLENWSSPYYMPPERIQGLPEDHRADFYSLGTTLYYMLTDHLPFFDLDDEVVRQRKCTESAPDPSVYRPGVNPKLAALAMRLLERDPEKRPANHAELLKLIASIREQQSGDAVSPAPASPPPKPGQKAILPRKEPPWIMFLLLGLGLAGALLIAKMTRGSEAPLASPTSTPTSAALPQLTSPPAAKESPSPILPLPTVTTTPQRQPSPAPTPLPEAPRVTLPPPLHHLRVNTLQVAPASLVDAWGPPGGEPVFLQPDPTLQPRLEESVFGTSPGLRFSGGHMFSGIAPGLYSGYSILILVRAASSEGSSREVIAGIPPSAICKSRFAIQFDRLIGGAVRVETARGAVIMNLPRGDRDKPFIVALSSSADGEIALLGEQIHRLAPHNQPPPTVDPDGHPGIHLGGYAGARGFNGWIGQVVFYPQALGEKELAEAARRIRQEYGVPQ